MSSNDKVNPNDQSLNSTRDRDTNPDPITGAPGSHPVGTGVGAAAGGAGATMAGAAIGAAAGPIGALVGGAIGAVVGAVGGGAAGKAVAENIDPTGERDYWSKNYNQRPYYETGYSYDDDYAPAYQHGWEGRARYGGKTFTEAEPTLREEWDRTKAKSRLGWDKAKSAVRDAWDRVSDKTERAAYPDSSRTTSASAVDDRNRM